MTESSKTIFRIVLWTVPVCFVLGVGMYFIPREYEGIGELAGIFEAATAKDLKRLKQTKVNK